MGTVKSLVQGGDDNMYEICTATATTEFDVLEITLMEIPTTKMQRLKSERRSYEHQPQQAGQGRTHQPQPQQSGELGLALGTLEVLAGLEYATDAAIKAFSNSQMTQWAMVHKETWSQKVESEVRPMFTRHWHQHRSSQRSDGTVGPRKVEDAWLTY